MDQTIPIWHLLVRYGIYAADYDMGYAAVYFSCLHLTVTVRPLVV